MRLRSALPWIVASALLAGCGSRAVPTADSDPDLEQQNGEEREALLNAVEEHPSMQNEDLAGPPIDVPTTIPLPAPGNMSGMNMNQATPDDSNMQAPVDANSDSSPTN